MSSFPRNPREAGAVGGGRPPENWLPDLNLDQPSEKLFDEVAESIAMRIAESRVRNANKSTQIRRFYDEVSRFADRHPATAAANPEAFRRELPFIRMICARAAYAKTRGLVDADFVAFLQKGLREVNSPRELGHFRALFEAVIGFSPERLIGDGIVHLIHILDLRGEIELLTGLHIGAGDLAMRIGGVDNAVIRNVRDNLPYIPGSSLKGKIRSLLEWRSGAIGGENGEPLSLEALRKVAGQPAEPQVEAILKLFGVSGDQSLDEANAARFGVTRVSFHDASLIDDQPPGGNLPVTEVKSENSIDRIRGVAKNPRQTERVAAGVRFAFRVTVKVLDKSEDLLPTLLAGMRLLELDSLGGSGSRGYGKVRFRSLTLDGRDLQSVFDAIDPFAPPQGAAA